MAKTTKQAFVDYDVQQVLGTLLRVGVIVSTAIAFIGGVIFVFANKNNTVSYQDFKPESTKFSSVSEILKGLSSFDGLAIIQFGVLLLIFTPIARVVFSIFSFLIEKDYMYVVIGLIVLGVIITSLYLDIAH